MFFLLSIGNIDFRCRNVKYFKKTLLLICELKSILKSGIIYIRETGNITCILDVQKTKERIDKMKLDFNYDGKTKLKDWWGKVKANFQTVQDRFNALDDKVSKETTDRQSADAQLQQNIDTEITDRQAADNALQDNIDTETSKRQSADNLLQQNINKEIADRQQQDGNLQSQINKINETSGREALFGKHKIQFVTDLGIPVVQFEGEQMYYGEEITVKTGDYNMSFYVDGALDTSGQQSDISIPANGTSYIIVRYEFATGDISILHSETYVESVVENGYWNFTAYEYSNFNYDFKMDSESPTGDRYELISYDKNYSSENVDTDTYTVEQKYGTSDRTLEDLKTENKDSFLDAVNEIAVTLSPINHRNIFRGKNLGSTVTEAQKTAIQSGTFDDLFVGDYWEIDGINWRIVDMDYWLNTGEPFVTRHHVVIMPDTCLYDYVMNDTATTNGGFLRSKLYGEGLEEARTIINNNFNGILMEYSEYLSNSVVDGKTVSYDLRMTTVVIPNENMMFGKHICGSLDNSIPTKLFEYSKTQLALFKIAPEFISNKENYWLRDVASSTGYVDMYQDGSVGIAEANDNTHGVRPVFAIG